MSYESDVLRHCPAGRMVEDLFKDVPWRWKWDVKVAGKDIPQQVTEESWVWEKRGQEPMGFAWTGSSHLCTASACPPMQKNHIDCGMFVMMYAYHVAYDVEMTATSFTEEDVANARDHVLAVAGRHCANYPTVEFLTGEASVRNA